MGYFCGACHNGSDAFGHTDGNCDKCHAGETQFSTLDFKRVWNALPPAKYGNGIDWVRSARKLKREYSIFYSEYPMKYKTILVLEAELGRIPPAYFPHKPHVRELACNNCHPEPFDIKKKGTIHFSMNRILEGQFCGACHMTVAFPMKDCRRCHPGIKRET
jgi:c(7)-type cytochrome triheme protein